MYWNRKHPSIDSIQPSGHTPGGEGVAIVVFESHLAVVVDVDQLDVVVVVVDHLVVVVNGVSVVVAVVAVEVVLVVVVEVEFVNEISVVVVSVELLCNSRPR